MVLQQKIMDWMIACLSNKVSQLNIEVIGQWSNKFCYIRKDSTDSKVNFTEITISDAINFSNSKYDKDKLERLTSEILDKLDIPGEYVIRLVGNDNFKITNTPN